MSFESIYPYNGETIASYPAHTAQELQDKLKAGHRAYNALRQAGVAQRSHWMKQVAELLKARADEHAALITREMGKTLKEAKAEVLKCASTAEYYANNIEGMLQPRIIPSDARNSYAAFEPKGIILAIMPWNFPFWQVFRFAIPNLLAGNAAVLKHASNVSGCGLAIENVFKEAGFPEGAFQALLVASKDIEPIIADPRVQGVTLTGSTPAGMSVASLAGRHLKRPYWNWAAAIRSSCSKTPTSKPPPPPP